MIATVKDNGAEMFPLVDEQGNVVGKATRAECHGGSMLLHPVVHLHVFNRQGELFLQKRPEWKDIQPGRWDTAVGGHVDLNETILQALFREASEEIGITLTEITQEACSSSGWVVKVVASEAPKATLDTNSCDSVAVTASLVSLKPYVFQSSRERELVHPFCITTDVPLRPSAETAGGRFWPLQEIVDNLGTGVFTPNFEQEFTTVLSEK